jgi:predicted CoA-binding protein
MTQPSVAIVGASADRQKFGNKAVRAYARSGYQVFPIHPKAGLIEGIPAYRSVLDVPLETLDRVSIYLHPDQGLHILDEVARKPAKEIWLNPGAESAALIAKGHQLGLNIIVGCSITAIGVDPHTLGS